MAKPQSSTFEFVISPPSKTTIYYISHKKDYIYYVPVTKVSNDNREKIEIIINELSSYNTYTTSLKSYLNADTVLLLGSSQMDYGEDDNEVILGDNGYGADVIAIVEI